MVATEAANLSIIWADDRTALGYSQLAARTTRSSKAARARRRQHSYLPVDTRSLMIPLLSRFASRVGLVTLRQTFVRRSHPTPFVLALAHCVCSKRPVREMRRLCIGVEGETGDFKCLTLSKP
jgi:hypothetical protein